MVFAPTLTDQEHRALVLAANGKERPDVARILKISEHAAKNLITGACTKLGADNTSHAVAIGFCTGLLIEHNIDGFHVSVRRAG